MTFSERNECKIVNYYFVKLQLICQAMAHLHEAKPAAFVSRISTGIFEEFYCHLLLRQNFQSKINEEKMQQ